MEAGLPLKPTGNSHNEVRQGKRPNIAKGDVVIVKNDVSNRIFWKLAVVQDLIAGDDQQVRIALVKVSDHQGNSRLLRKSVKHLYPIKVRNKDTEESQTPNNEENTVTVHSSKNPEDTESQGNR